MIVIKEKDAVYFASPMKCQNFVQQVDLDYSLEENGSIWHLCDGKGTIVMVSAKNRRAEDLIRYSDVFDCEFSMAGMSKVAENIRNLFKGTNCFMPSESLGMRICVARGNGGYVIAPSGAILDIAEIECIRDKEMQILTAYENCREIEDVFERIKAIYGYIGEQVGCRVYPISVISTKDDSYTLLTE